MWNEREIVLRRTDRFTRPRVVSLDARPTTDSSDSIIQCVYRAGGKKKQKRKNRKAAKLWRRNEQLKWMPVVVSSAEINRDSVGGSRGGHGRQQ